MRLNKFSLGAALAAPLALAACGGEAGTFDLNLLHKDCTGQVDFIPPTASLTVKVTGDGMKEAKSFTVSNAGRSGSADMDGIPFGNNRVVTVEAKANGSVLAWGQSAPFNLKEGDSPKVTVVMQGVDRFTSAADVDNSCIQMGTARAAHTAVQMEDGNVLLVGGVTRIAANNGLGEGHMKSAEIYNIATGKFEPARDPCEASACYEGAYGQGVLLNDGRVFIAGGEGLREGARRSLDMAMIYDPATQQWTAMQMLHARRGHTATLLRRSGKVLIAGGIDETGAVLSSTEIFDPKTGTFVEGPPLQYTITENGNPVTKTGRAFHVAVAANEGMIMIQGGVHADGSPALRLQPFGETASGSIDSTNNSRAAVLSGPAILPGGGMVGSKLVVAGGAQAWSLANDRFEGAAKAAQWMELASGPATAENLFELAFQRVAPCTVSLDSNRLLVAGGFNGNGNAVDYAEVLAWNASNKRVEQSFIGGSQVASKMALARSYPTCTSLGDGRVLVTGGASLDGGGAASNSAEIYTIRQF